MVGDGNKARAAFQKVVDGSPDTRLVGNAKKELAALEAKAK